VYLDTFSLPYKGKSSVTSINQCCLCISEVAEDLQHHSGVEEEEGESPVKKRQLTKRL
jgi:hypothetical protein